MVVGAALFQDALATLLERRLDAAMGRAGAAPEAIALARKTSPEIVLVELTPDGRLLPLLRALGRLRPVPRTILISNHATAETIQAGIEAGAQACISTEGGSAELMKALDAVRENQRYIGPMISGLVMQSRLPPVPGLAAELTGRERQVLALVAQGQTERQIAKQLGLSPRTVHTYRTSLMSKLRVHNVIALVRRALDLGLVRSVLLAASLAGLVHPTHGRRAQPFTTTRGRSFATLLPIPAPSTASTTSSTSL
jgi:DNA-binding NarL/FixJ family response regulator